MSVKGWKYYNHALIPTCAPHEEPDVTSVVDGLIWKYNEGKKSLFARWTTDFDCKEETNWWYVIKDNPLDITTLKAKRRYEITKGCRYFEVRLLEDPMEYADELCDVQIAAFSAYPEKYRPTVDKERFVASLSGWKNATVYGAFSREDNRLCGYAYLTQEENVLHFSVLKTCPDSEKLAVNAALVYKILFDYQDKLVKGCYICDGARSVFHETAFQDYLEKYFGFRKAYCRLHIEYNPKVKWLILFLYHFRGLFRKFDSVGLIHSMNGVFTMQEIVEEQKTRK